MCEWANISWFVSGLLDPQKIAFILFIVGFNQGYEVGVATDKGFKERLHYLTVCWNMWFGGQCLVMVLFLWPVTVSHNGSLSVTDHRLTH